MVVPNYWIFARMIMTTQFTMAKFCVGPEEEEVMGGAGCSCNEMRDPT